MNSPEKLIYDNLRFLCLGYEYPYRTAAKYLRQIHYRLKTIYKAHYENIQQSK